MFVHIWIPQGNQKMNTHKTRCTTKTSKITWCHVAATGHKKRSKSYIGIFLTVPYFLALVNSRYQCHVISKGKTILNVSISMPIVHV